MSVECWRDQAYRRGISNGETDRAKQRAFSRAREQLIAFSRVGVWEDFVWLPS